MPVITEDIRPKNDADFATHADSTARGGFRAVADVATRDAITLDRRSEGMQVYVVANDTTYRKSLPLSDNGGTWTVVSSGSGVTDPDVRAYTVPAGALTDIYVDAAGNDSDAGGLATPLATIGEAIRRVAIATGQTEAVTIHVGAGVFAFPETVSLANWITIEGTEATGTAMAVATVVNSTPNGGIVIDVTGIAGSVADQHRGKLIEFSSGAANGLRGWVYRNNSSVGANTRLYLTQDDPDALVAPGLLDTLTFLDLSTELQHTGIPVITSSVQLNVRSAVLSGSQPLFFNVTDKVEYRFCRFELTNPVIGRYGSAFLWCCYVGGEGNDTNGLLGVVNTGFGQLERGTVVDATFGSSVAGSRFINVENGGRLVIKGQVVVRDLEAGVVVTNSDLIADNPVAVNHALLFESELGSAPNNANGIVYDGAISQGCVPHLYGHVVSTYGVVAAAAACACVRIPSSSALGTGSVLNAVSADGGLSAVSEHLQSVIYGGSPDERRIVPQVDDQGTIGESGRRWSTIYTNDLVTGDLVMEAKDGSARYRFVEAANGVIIVTDEVSGRRYLLPLIPITTENEP